MRQTRIPSLETWWQAHQAKPSFIPGIVPRRDLRSHRQWPVSKILSRGERSSVSELHVLYGLYLAAFNRGFRRVLYSVMIV
jgi:hypothetical protein